MSFYENTGYLAFGSWLKKLSNQFQQDVLRIYAHEGLRFELSWFPIFYLLDQHTFLSVTEISNKLEISHPAVIQVLDSLEKESLIEIIQDEKDKRRRLVRFTSKGEDLHNKVIPIWETMNSSMEQLMNEHTKLSKYFRLLTRS
jgi:DNA-binding MarR family transcriptional regulator